MLDTTYEAALLIRLAQSFEREAVLSVLPLLAVSVSDSSLADFAAGLADDLGAADFAQIGQAAGEGLRFVAWLLADPERGESTAVVVERVRTLREALRQRKSP